MSKLGRTVLTFLLVAPSILLALPTSVSKCLARHPEVTLDQSQKPSYLHLSFTASRVPDYAVAVREHESKLARVMVCMHDGKDVMLRERSLKQPFSDMNDDNYMSSKWRVCTRKQVIAMRQYYQGVPDPANESVCFLWEDAEAVIYWDGSQFRWKRLVP